ncbi:MAG: DNA polymerase III subunit beta [Alphaproteobacteria bacterium]|nr:DNA polymerase III subunit beta [Alphaproteobacteria bacterium]
MTASAQASQNYAAAFGVKIERGQLLKALAHVQSVVERRNTIPVLGNVKLEAGGGQLRLTATDMDIAVVETVAADTQNSGVTTAPAHTFYDIVRKLPEGSEIELTTEPEKGLLTIKAGKSRFSLSCLPAEDFPQLEKGEFSHEFTLAAAEAVALLDKCRFAISTEETRYYLNGIYIHAAGSEDAPVLRAVATDGHRLARIEVGLPAGAAGMPGVILPRKAVGELRKLIEEAGGEVQVSVSKTKMRFLAGNASLVTKLIDGTFPDYERVIPQGNDKLAEIETAKFAEAIDRVATITSEKTRAIRLVFEQGNLNLSASSPEQGTATESLEITYSADSVDIGFNSRYLLDVMAQIDGDSVQFQLADASSPALVRDPAEVGALYVVMPMRI